MQRLVPAEGIRVKHIKTGEDVLVSRRKAHGKEVDPVCEGAWLYGRCSCIFVADR